MNFIFANNVKTTLAANFPSSSVYLTVASTQNIPTIPVGNYLPVSLNDAATGNVYEIVYATAINGSTLTVIRGQEGTRAQSWGVGDFVYVAPTAQTVAPVNGSPNNVFQVQASLDTNSAINYGFATSTFARILGSSSNDFQVFGGTQFNSAVSYGQAINKFLQLSNIGFNYSGSGNSLYGSFRIPAPPFANPLIFNFGIAPIQDDQYSPVYFFTPFTVSALAAFATPSYNGVVTQTASLAAHVGNVGLTSMNVGASIPTTTFPINGVYWLAIGY